MTESGSWAALHICVSEFAGFLARPALDHDFGFGEKFNGVASLPVKNAEKAFFPSAEGEIGHGRGNPDVDANVACRRFVTELARRRAAGGEERSLVPVRAAAEKFHGVV